MTFILGSNMLQAKKNALIMTAIVGIDTDAG